MSENLSAAEATIVARFEAGEPAPESWRGDDGLRSTLAEALVGRLGGWARDYDDAARNVLALPEIAALRAKAAAADRVRELAENWTQLRPKDRAKSPAAAVRNDCGDAILTALDGPPC